MERLTGFEIFTQVLALALLANCTAQTGGYQAPEFGAAPPGAPDGTCWGRLETPAVIETVTEQVLVQPAVLVSAAEQPYFSLLLIRQGWPAVLP